MSSGLKNNVVVIFQFADNTEFKFVGHGLEIVHVKGKIINLLCNYLKCNRQRRVVESVVEDGS